jgi:hypothetical protein
LEHSISIVRAENRSGPSLPSTASGSMGSCKCVLRPENGACMQRSIGRSVSKTASSAAFLRGAVSLVDPQGRVGVLLR